MSRLTSFLLLIIAFSMMAMASAADIQECPSYKIVDLRTGVAQTLLEAPADLLADISYKKDKLVLRRIPKGVFRMGSTKAEQDALVKAGAKPEWIQIESPHDVELTKDYYMGVFEVTQGQWQLVMGSNPSYFKNAGPDAPVEQVSIDDCQEFLRRVNAKNPGLESRLPTEAEWERACRAGSDTALYTGPITVKGACNSPELDVVAWYSGNSGVMYEGGFDCSKWAGKQYDCKYAGTHSVGMKRPNVYGLYDTIGNVWEWCSDWYEPYSGAKMIDPAGPAASSRRAVRGGSWSLDAFYCRPANRGNDNPLGAYRYLGFRVAANAPAPAQ